MKKIHSKKAPKAVGPYSQAVDIGDLVYLSGQIGLIPETMKLIEGGFQNQTHQICKNITEVLKEAGLELNNVFKTTIFLTNINDFKGVNEIYGEYFSHKPARSTVEVSKLPLGAQVEIEVIAKK